MTKPQRAKQNTNAHNPNKKRKTAKEFSPPLPNSKQAEKEGKEKEEEESKGEECIGEGYESKTEEELSKMDIDELQRYLNKLEGSKESMDKIIRKEKEELKRKEENKVNPKDLESLVEKWTCAGQEVIQEIVSLRNDSNIKARDVLDGFKIPYERMRWNEEDEDFE